MLLSNVGVALEGVFQSALTDCSALDISSFHFYNLDAKTITDTLSYWILNSPKRFTLEEFGVSDASGLQDSVKASKMQKQIQAITIGRRAMDVLASGLGAPEYETWTNEPAWQKTKQNKTKQKTRCIRNCTMLLLRINMTILIQKLVA